ncbi:phage tail tape measure protein [Flavobacterium sp. T12S277]|uniref:phage tail tape measure protein n=1 Tax=Flavobacterium sp. T12S277 TaxID=3402752 RepID=UPI003AEED817
MAGENINRRLNIYINDREVVNSMRGITSEMGRVRNEMRNLNRNAADYNERMAHLRNTYARLTEEQARFRRDLNQVPSVLGRIRTALGPVASGMLAAFSVSSLISTFTAKMREGWTTIVEFDQKQATLAATMQKTRTQIAGLTLDAIKVGAGSAYSASEVSDLQLELAKLGKTAPEIKAMTKDVLNAATSLETELGNAAVLVGGQLNSYGESADKAGKYSDIMANSVNISATSYEYLNTALPKTSAVAALNNVTFEKLNATMGVLADQNIQAETSGTGFRNILLESSKAGKPYQVLLDKIKVSNDQAKTATELFGKENATVAVILANSTQKINDQTKALENSAGSAEKLAKEKMNSLKGAIEGFSGAWEGFLLSLEQGDGLLARTVKGVIELGTAFLNLITPMKNVSDELADEQLGLNMLVSKITSTNVKNEERKQLLVELKNEYPDFVKFIDIETVSNGELNDSLNKVNEQYIKRIALQKQVEKVESEQNDTGVTLARKLAAQEKLFKRLNSIKADKNLTSRIDYGDLAKSAKSVIEELTKRGSFQGLFSDVAGIKADMRVIEAFDFALKSQNSSLKEQTDILERQKKLLGINTEAENAKAKAIAAEAEAMKKLREEAKLLGMKDAMTASNEQVKIWLNAYKERLKYSQSESEEDRKKREKALADAKKHTEDLHKEEEELQKKLIASRRNAEDIKNQSIIDEYNRERAILNDEYDRKIEDAKENVRREDYEINKLRKAISNPKTTKEDVTSFKKQLSDRLEIQKLNNNQLIDIEKIRDLKLLALREKFVKKDFDEQEKENERSLQTLQAKHNAELSQIRSLETAKQILKRYLNADELSKITTLENAKKEIKKKYLTEEIKLQEDALVGLMTRIQNVFDEEKVQGIELLSPQEREDFLLFLDQYAAKLNELGVKKTENEEPEKKPTGLDLLGYTQEQWQIIFNNFDTLETKIEGIGMGFVAVSNAYGMYSNLMAAGEKRSLQKFEADNRKKQSFLNTQLEKGFITQEVYNAKKAKLDNDLAKKKAEIEYKQAKREKMMNIVSIIGNTAVGVSKALAQGGIAGIVIGALVAAFGAVQLATAIKQPLPDKNGYYQGGYTGDGNPKTESNALGNKDYTYHNGEYVIPNKVLFSNDPVMPNIMSYLEQKRAGKQASFQSDSGREIVNHSTSNSNSGSSEFVLEILKVLERNTDVLEKIQADGIIAFLVNDFQNAKKIRDKIKELTKLENSAKP